MKCPYCKKEFLTKQATLRSIPENKYYWGVIVEILSDELGYSKFETHEILKEKFLREPKFIQTKEGMIEIWIPKSTASLSTTEFEGFLADIRGWAVADLGIVIPLPKEVLND